MTKYQKKYDCCGRQLVPEDSEDPMYSELYCHEYITECDRVLRIVFDDSFMGDVGKKNKPVTIRIDASYNTIDSIHNILKEHFGGYPDIENTLYFYIKNKYPTILLSRNEWLDKPPYYDILVKNIETI